MLIFSDISDDELDVVVQSIQYNSPISGVIMVWGELKSYGISVPTRRVRESLVRVSPGNTQLCASTTILRRVYSLPSSNALWHIDGLHCFVLWRIVIRGGIDVYFKQIVYLVLPTTREIQYSTCLWKLLDPIWSGDHHVFDQIMEVKILMCPGVLLARGGTWLSQSFSLDFCCIGIVIVLNCTVM